MSYLHPLKLIGSLGLGCLMTSCSLFGLQTDSQARKASAHSYQRGLREGTAREVRRSHLEAQREKERPAPPPQVEYYPLPVPAHTSEDGVKIEAHTVTIPIIKN